MRDTEEKTCFILCLFVGFVQAPPTWV